MDYKISVIVPVYNVENYLSQCMESIINQTLKDIEIICINDGSTDLSKEILEKFQKEDKRIILVSKSNGGYGSACNTGLSLARGEYISIVEPDDYIDKNMLFPQSKESVYPSGDEVVAIAKPDALTLKACLYAVCAEFYSRTRFLERTRDNTLALDILAYIENNYASDISLKTMADSLGYDFRYISRIFGKTFEINFKTLVNQYRCDRAKSLISSTDDTLSAIAMNSGFQSIRSFNRVFRELTGSSPSDLRK